MVFVGFDQQTCKWCVVEKIGTWFAELSYHDTKEEAEKEMNSTKTTKLDEFTLAYIEAALWSTNDNSDEQGGEPLDKNYDIEDINKDTLLKMISDCARFQEENAELIIEDNYIRVTAHSVEEMAGHDFWLTREGHGAGFWDGDWEEEVGIELTKAAKKFGEFNLYVGDDGKIYGM